MAEDNRVRKEISLELRCNLSEKEWKEYARRQADGVNRLADSKAEAKEVASQYKATADKLEAEIRELAKKLSAGYEIRSVPVEEVWDYERATVTRFRLDTNELVDERTMTSAERQRGLEFAAGQGADPDQEED